MWESYPCSTGDGPIDLAIVQSWPAFWSKSSDFPWCSVDCIFQYTLVSGCKALHEICLDLSFTAISAIVWPNHDGKLPRTAKAAWVRERYLSSFARLSRTGCHHPAQAYSTYFSLHPSSDDLRHDSFNFLSCWTYFRISLWSTLSS